MRNPNTMKVEISFVYISWIIYKFDNLSRTFNAKFQYGHCNFDCVIVISFLSIVSMLCKTIN